MSAVLFFDDVDASLPQISAEFTPDCGQDIEWLLQVTKTGTDGDPKLFLEESVDGILWTPVMDYDCDDVYDYFLINDSPYSIRDNHWMGFKMRLRSDPNGVTVGTINANLGYRTKL